MPRHRRKGRQDFLPELGFCGKGYRWLLVGDVLQEGDELHWGNGNWRPTGWAGRNMIPTWVGKYRRPLKGNKSNG